MRDDGDLLVELDIVRSGIALDVLVASCVLLEQRDATGARCAECQTLVHGFRVRQAELLCECLRW